MHDWFACLDGDGQRYPPLVRAALAHELLLAIHPLLDGNGRTARLILNLQLMEAGTRSRCCCAAGGQRTCARSRRPTMGRTTRWSM